MPERKGPAPISFPPEWLAQARAAYDQYVDERERDLSEGIQPATDELQPWGEFLSQYLYAELECAAS